MPSAISGRSMAQALRCALAQKIRDRSYSAWGPIRKEDEGFSKGEGGKRNLVLIFFSVDARLSEKCVGYSQGHK
jgi:hypothetical protein